MAANGPQPTMGLEELRHGARVLSERRQDARRDFERYAREEAEADHEYRVVLAKVMTRERANGEPASVCEVMAKAAAAEAKLRCSLAASMAKAALLRIEECERDSATLRAIGEWSQRIDPAA